MSNLQQNICDNAELQRVDYIADPNVSKPVQDSLPSAFNKTSYAFLDLFLGFFITTSTSDDISKETSAFIKCFFQAEKFSFCVNQSTILKVVICSGVSIERIENEIVSF